MKSIANNRGVLVLGMHRSGTSAVTAGLKALGVQLGPKNDYVNEENPKGFFENQDVIQLNDRIFEQIGSSWNNPFTGSLGERIHALDAFHDDAVAILEKSYKDKPIWCLKDPRISLLLPFWQKVIARSLGCEIMYVHVLRNPLEVAGSLQVRGERFKQFLRGDVQQSLLLWFSYHFHALATVDVDKNILVTFDDLIQDPSKQLNRLASFLDIEPDKEQVQDYVDSFLEKGLKHHAASINILRYQYPDFAFVADLYENLVELKGSSSFDRKTIKKILSGIPDLKLFQACCKVAEHVFQDAISVNALLQKKNPRLSQVVPDRDRQLVNLAKVVSERGRQLANLTEIVSERDRQVASLTKVVSERGRQLASLTEIVSERDRQVASLTKVVSERGRQLASLTEIVSERDRQVASLTKAVSELAALAQVVSNRDERVDYLQQLLTERHEQIAGLTRAVTAGDEQRVQLANEIEKMNAAGLEKDNQFTKLKERYLQVTFSLPWTVVLKVSPFLMKVPGLLYIDDKVRTAVDARRVNKAKDLIKQSGLFDSEYYLKLYPDVKEEELRPISHFIQYGVFEGRRPNATFDPEFYLKLYLDVGISGLNPLVHYILFGKDRGYLTQSDAGIMTETSVLKYGSTGFSTDHQHPLDTVALLPGVDIFGCFDAMDTSQETVMVVSHEGSRTGAPILSYNLVKKLLGKYNVVALFLGPGPMAEACSSEGAVCVVSPKEYRFQPEMAGKLIDAVTGSVNLKFALVNSIESRCVLDPLGKAYVPTVCLIHEFAAYTRPVYAFGETALWSGTVVFSSRVTYNNMVAEHPYLGKQKCEILPQGRCEVPVGSIEDREEAATDPAPEPDMNILRPAGFPANGIVVLGAGFVQIRKGVDLFISCAAKAIANFPDVRFRFVWVGKGYDPVHSMDYSVYLADQVVRSGLEDHVFFMNEVDDIEAVYAQVDIMLLSSRLDPLPNVAIDAFFNELPVVCFSETTGIAEVLDDFGLSDFCVADYLDVDDMANKVGRLAQSADLRRDVTDKARIQAVDIFDMDLYAEQLGQFALQAENGARQEREDVKTIAASGLLDCDFFVPSFLEDNEVEEIIRYYVRSWASGVFRRKLFPGFHPGVYREQHGTATTAGDPLADYIREGKPAGPWNFDLILPGQQPDLSHLDLRVGLHIHAYYPELLPDLLDRLAQDGLKVELLISVVSEQDSSVVLGLLEKYEFQHKVLVVPNRGRDIGPFLTGFGDGILAEYDIIGHMHTKKSLDCDEEMGRVWYSFLLENLIGGKAPMAGIIIEKMSDNPDIAMVFPCDPNVISWDSNYNFGEKLLRGWGVGTIPQEFEMPVGNMFWARSTVLKKLFDLNLQWEDYPDEPVPYDGTLLHAIERSLGFLATTSGKSVALSHVPGVSR